jgi:lycopene beta-cyclase
VHRRWTRLRVVTARGEESLDLGSYRYEMMRGIDFYRFVLHEVAARMQMDLIHGSVEQVVDGQAEAAVVVGEHTYTGRWVFDSRPAPLAEMDRTTRGRRLRQQFTGWSVTTTRPAFTPRIATLMDFRVAQAGSMRFFYVLPFSEYQAMVEYVTCTHDDLSAAEHERALAEFLETRIGVTDYRAEQGENGASLLTDRPFPRRLGRHVMTVGIPGGRVKCTTGYGFMRIEQDSAAIVRSLERAGHPFDVPADSWRYRRYDAAMFDVMVGRGEQIMPMFALLFHRNPIERVFRFLDECSSPWDDLQIAASLPPSVALRAVFRR